MIDDEDIERWITVNGQHIPIRNGQSARDAVRERQIAYNAQEAKERNTDRSYYKAHQKAIKTLSSDKYGSGTYNVNTLKPVEFSRGYQFTFCQIGDDYSESEYNALVSGILSKLENKNVFAGKFEGTPEISFYTLDKNFAMEIGKRYNQISIWDWENCDEIKTGGTGRRK